MALWNERRPECARQLTGETEGSKIASARAPTRLQRCPVCDKWLHTGPSRLLLYWRAAFYPSQNDPLYVANYGSLVRELRSTWIATKMEHYQERCATTRRDNLASCLPQERFERCLGRKSELLPFSPVLDRRVDGSAQQGTCLSFSLANLRMSFFCRRPAPHSTSSGR